MTLLSVLVIGGIVAYLLGSIPTAVWLGKSRYGIDVREHGSGNAGATNTFRVLGKKAGSTVMAIDVTKGFLATFFPVFLNLSGLTNLQGETLTLVQIGLGVLAVTGHILPVFAGFRGGKGVATLLGMVLAIHTFGALTCIAVFLLIFLTSGYVSLGSMLAGITFPILMLLPFYQENGLNKVLLIFGVVVSLLLIFTHRKNIQRLLKGEENSFKKKKTQ
ncbi:MAG: glycerol-3-phosphate 1-O-acyltransferase PlsY [Cytophagales bacterium]|nr:glycerol-3-phosphate 1-O-acyltransferase PlsY [Cytophagales bacterium]